MLAIFHKLELKRYKRLYCCRRDDIERQPLAEYKVTYNIVHGGMMFPSFSLYAPHNKGSGQSRRVVLPCPRRIHYCHVRFRECLHVH